MKLAKAIVLSVIFISTSSIAQISVQSQISPVDWTKNPATHVYSLEYEQKLKEDLILLNQNKYTKGIDIKKLELDFNSSNEEQRIRSIRLLGLMPQNILIPDIEELLQNDPSLIVRMECTKSLSQLKSYKSIPVLIKELKTEDTQLKLEIALALASLGEKKECFKILKELGQRGEWKITLDTHLGYLYLATKDAVAILIEDLTNSNSYVSVDAAIILAQLGYSKEAFKTLKLKLTDQDKYIRMSALRGLAYIGNNAAIELIRNMLYDSEPIIRDRSVLILTKCNLL